MWRTFDYPTYFALYFNLYRIAKQRPDLVQGTRAPEGISSGRYGTARVYFEVPANIRMEGGWSFTGWVYWQYTVGNFHEKYLLPLIAALETEGRQAKADYSSQRVGKEGEVLRLRPSLAVRLGNADGLNGLRIHLRGRPSMHWSTELQPDTNLWHDLNLQK